MRSVTRTRRTAQERAEIQQDALNRATNERSFANYALIIEGFAARGIPAEDILPRVNVFTYNAWRALGRTVRRGEKGLKITSWAPINAKEKDNSTGETVKRERLRPVSAVVFHISQTEPLA